MVFSFQVLFNFCLEHVSLILKSSALASRQVFFFDLPLKLEKFVTLLRIYVTEVELFVVMVGLVARDLNIIFVFVP